MLGHVGEEVELLFSDCVEDERIGRIGDDAHAAEIRSLNRGHVVTEDCARTAQFFAGVGVDDEEGDDDEEDDEVNIKIKFTLK